MEFDYRRLSGRIVERFGTRSAFAKAIGMAPSALSHRLSGHTLISTEATTKWGEPDMLDIPAEDIHMFFLTPKSSKN